MSSRHSVMRGSLDTEPGPDKCQMLLLLFCFLLATWQSSMGRSWGRSHFIRSA